MLLPPSTIKFRQLRIVSAEVIGKYSTSSAIGCPPSADSIAASLIVINLSTTTSESLASAGDFLSLALEEPITKNHTIF